MVSNQDIANFFAVELPTIREGVAIAFDLYVHLSLNQRIVHFRSKSSETEEGFVESYRLKNLHMVYIPKSQRLDYENYLTQMQELENSRLVTDAIAALERQTAAASNDLTTNQNGADSQNINDLRKPAEAADSTNAAKVSAPNEEDTLSYKNTSPYLEDPEQAQPNPQAELTEDQSQRLERAMKKMASKDSKKRLTGVEECRILAKEVVMPGEAANSVFAQLWDAAQEKHTSGHGANVATFSVLFAMALENHDRSLLKDIALAGLVHDLGLSQLETAVVRTPTVKRTKEQQAHFEGHLGLTLQMLTGLDIVPPPRTAALILQHHEKFDGTGYPRHLKNWDIDALAQTLSMADVFDTMFQGQYDGQPRTITQAFRDIVTIEKSKIFPQYYNPDLFSKLTKWIQTNTDEVILDEASEIVEETFESAKKKVV